MCIGVIYTVAGLNIHYIHSERFVTYQNQVKITLYILNNYNTIYSIKHTFLLSTNTSGWAKIN